MKFPISGIHSEIWRASQGIGQHYESGNPLSNSVSTECPPVRMISRYIFFCRPPDVSRLSHLAVMQASSDRHKKIVPVIILNWSAWILLRVDPRQCSPYCHSNFSFTPLHWLSEGIPVSPTTSVTAFFQFSRGTLLASWKVTQSDHSEPVLVQPQRENRKPQVRVLYNAIAPRYSSECFIT